MNELQDNVTEERNDLPAKTLTGAEGPDAHPVASLLLADLVLLAGTHFLNQIVEKKILNNQYDCDELHENVDKKGSVPRTASHTFSKIAKRSLPGAVLVGAGLAAKFVYDKSEQRRNSVRNAEPQSEKGERIS